MIRVALTTGVLAAQPSATDAAGNAVTNASGGGVDELARVGSESWRRFGGVDSAAMGEWRSGAYEIGDLLNGHIRPKTLQG